MKYRIIECKKRESTWYEVERKRWFGWGTEDAVCGLSIFLTPEYSPFEFESYERAKDYIDKKRVAETAKAPLVTRSVYETFDV